MRKRLIFYLTLLCMSLLTFSSCDIDNSCAILYPQPFYGIYWQPYSPNGNGQYVIGGYVNGQQTRAMTRAALADGYESFALYAWTADSVVMDGYHGVFNGNTWGYEENLKYFDNDVAEYNFIGVMPQNANQTFNNGKVTVEAEGFTTDDEGAQTGEQNGIYAEDRELLYASTTVRNIEYSQGATLNFKHANVKVYIKFTSDDPNTEIVDFTPYREGTPEVPATPGTETEKTTRMFDELVSGNTVGWPYAVGTEQSTYSGGTGTYMNYVGSNLSTARITNARLAELMPLVNAQFIYTDADGNDVSNNDWEKGVEKKNTVFLKFADNVDTDEFLAGNDAFWTNLTAEEKVSMQNWYNSGIRVARINQIASGDYFAWGMLNNQMTITVISGGTPYQPAVPATGHDGIIVLPATSEIGDGTDAILSSYPTNVLATIDLNHISMFETNNASTLTFTKPNGYVYTERVASPTTWYTFPSSANSNGNVGYTVKFSYTYKGVTKYDNRVFIPAPHTQWLDGKYYTYIINITGKGNGVVDPTEADEQDPTVPKTNEIIVTAVINDYESGEEHTYIIH